MTEPVTCVFPARSVLLIAPSVSPSLLLTVLLAGVFGAAEMQVPIPVSCVS